MSTRRMTFFFDAAACSGCKACQIACMDRHGLEPDRLWRRVSEVTGGGWEQDGPVWRNSVFAYHLSMACNHCARPICLEGCPAQAITQREDGVVLINPDHCLGCGYCGWVCPYTAPQYQSDRGVMTKCTFCADDLDVGQDPACVAACPVRALDAGDATDLAARYGAPPEAAEIAPLPAAHLTEPALQLAPHADAARSVEPDTQLTPRPPRGLREWSLVLFTVLSQTAAGIVLFAGGLRWWGRGLGDLDPVLLPTAVGLLAIAMVVSTLHLGRRRNVPRAILNLRTSWLSREILLALVLLVATGLAWQQSVVGMWLSVPAALAYLAGMAGVYLQRTVPVWNHARTPAAFLGTALLLGGLTANAVVWTAGAVAAPWGAILSWAGLSVALITQIGLRRQYYERYERMGV